ncbi:MAG: hypothetical protein H0V26_10855 [Solirubrobacterales bacterium]|nr:hypothetical protein [Solirubrobacterales bacterium]
MNTLRTLKKLVLGETWLLPVGVAMILLLAALVIRPLASGTWDHLGGFAILAGAGVVLVLSVARGARPR